MMVLITFLPSTGISKPPFHKMWDLQEFGLSLVQKNLPNSFISLHSLESGDLLVKKITTLGGFVSPIWE